MAKVVGGFGSGHGPLMSLPGDQWQQRSVWDMKCQELIEVPTGRHVTYEELLAGADPNIAKVVNVETFDQRVETIQKGLDELERRFVQTDPDVVVMFGDDQSEWFFEDNYPTISVYWGDTVKIHGRGVPVGGFRSTLAEDRDWPVDSELGLHVIQSLQEEEFDLATMRYQRETYGGSIGPSSWYLNFKMETEPRPFGLPHAYTFPIGRWFGGKTVPILPITINTCYPPNWISPKRAYALGQAVRRAVDAWGIDKKIAFACSGGLSHFVVDEELDRMALKAMSEADGEVLSTLPRHRLQSATTETLNWVACQGAMGNTPMDVITYEPGYRTPAGTGVGCAVGHWDVSR